uniref:Uncharacterized protein n=1 Tax=Leptospirillum ferriphilum TaxID=178606 RepID=A0A7C3R254_9BACT
MPTSRPPAGSSTFPGVFCAADGTGARKKASPPPGARDETGGKRYCPAESQKAGGDKRRQYRGVRDGAEPPSRKRRLHSLAFIANRVEGGAILF